MTALHAVLHMSDLNSCCMLCTCNANQPVLVQLAAFVEPEATSELHWTILLSLAVMQVLHLCFASCLEGMSYKAAQIWFSHDYDMLDDNALSCQTNCSD